MATKEAIDYDQLVAKIKEKMDQMTYWPQDNKAESAMRTAMSVLIFQGHPFDTHSSMALEIRTACYQYLVLRDEASEHPQHYAEHKLADSLRTIREKYWNRVHGVITGKKKSGGIIGKILG